MYPMFIAALFIIARTWKQPRCPSADEWIRKLWYIYTMEYYSAIKKNIINLTLVFIICCQVTSVVSDSVRPHRWQPTRLHCPWDSPGKNTGVGCHFLLQRMKVKSESEVAQSCPTSATPWTAAHQAPPSLGFSRQEHWSGLPFPSPQWSITQPLKRMHLSQF